MIRQYRWRILAIIFTISLILLFGASLSYSFDLEIGHEELIMKSSLYAFNSVPVVETDKALPSPPSPQPSEPVAKAMKPREIVEMKAKEHGVPKELALDLANFESGMNPEARSKLSSATGLFQFINSTFSNYCQGEATNPEDNADCAMRLLAAREINHWTADVNTRKFLLNKGYAVCNPQNPEECRANY